MADKLGMCLDDVMEKTSSRQFLVWNLHIEEEWNQHTKLDTYLAAIMRSIDSLELTLQRAHSKRGAVKRKVKKLEKYYIQFKESSRIAAKKKEKRTPEERMKHMKFMFGLWLGAPPPEDVFNGKIKIHDPEAA